MPIFDSGVTTQMAYKHTNSKGVTYYLNSKAATPRGGRRQSIYYFSKDERPETAADLPSDRKVGENPINGFLTLMPKERPSAEGRDAEAEPLAESEDLGVAFSPQGLGLALLPPSEASLFRAPDGEIYKIGPFFAATVRGLERCVDRLDQLMKQDTASEADFQRCLEECPALLRVFGHADAIPHVVLEAAGQKLIPDFILRPIDTDLCDILELKLPTTPLLTGTETRPQLTRKIASGVKQLHEYAEALDDQQVRDKVQRRYGLELFQPRLYLIAGRSIALDRIRLKRAMTPDFRTELHTWDDIILRAQEWLR